MEVLMHKEGCISRTATNRTFLAGVLNMDTAAVAQ